MKNQNSIAGNLVYNRKLKGLTQKELSDRTNVTVRTIQRIEKGETEPHLQTVKLLAAAMEIEIEDLIPLEAPKEESIQQKWLLLLHATPFIGFVLPFFNVLVPLFLWIHKKDDHPLYYEHGRKVINFQLSILLYVVLMFFAVLFIGRLLPFATTNWSGIFLLLFILVIPFSVMVMLFNIFRAVKSFKCYYPLSIPFFKKKKGKEKRSKKVLVSLLLIIGFSFSAEAQEIERLDGSEISQDSLSSRIEFLMKEANVPGMGISIFNENKPVFSKSFGYRNNNDQLKLNDTTNMYGASLSKAVFSVITMKLVEENVIDLDTPLESYLPKKIYEYEPKTKWHDNYSDLENDSLYHKITARMCLSHTSGFPNWRWIEEDKKLRVNHEPGSRYMYSGEGMVYLQVVLEKIMGKSFEELAQETVFQPLNMNHSSYEWKTEFEDEYAYGHNEKSQALVKDKDNEPRAPSTLETTLEDYNKFMTAVLNREILSADSWNEIFSPQVRIHSLRQFGPLAEKDGNLFDDIELSYGLGWGLFKTPYGWGAFKEGGGSGFKHYSVIFPDSATGILIMTNSDNSGGIFKELLEVAIKDTYTPWEWNFYVPYNAEVN